MNKYKLLKSLPLFFKRGQIINISTDIDYDNIHLSPSSCPRGGTGIQLSNNNLDKMVKTGWLKKVE